MRCEVAREALSARLDGEREAVPASRVDEHLATCPECAAWCAAARRLRFRAPDVQPDLTSRILAAARGTTPADGGGDPSEPGRGRGATAREQPATGSAGSAGRGPGAARSVPTGRRRQWCRGPVAAAIVALAVLIPMIGYPVWSPSLWYPIAHGVVVLAVAAAVLACGWRRNAPAPDRSPAPPAGTALRAVPDLPGGGPPGRR
ncbi:hypothetical protein GCM10009624_02920 [Gordonia sinesedis]